MTALMTFTNVTIYRWAPMGWVGTRAKVASVEIAPYAQYTTAQHVTYRAPRQRLDRGFVITDGDLVIVTGHDCPERPSPMFGASTFSQGGAVECRHGRHSGCSPEWTAEFSAWLVEAQANGLRVLADFRTAPHGESEALRAG